MSDNIPETTRCIFHCENCDTIITRTLSETRGKRIFCSKSCSATYYNKPKIIIKECRNCNTKFHPLRGNTGKYCSKKCQQELQRKQIYANIESGNYKSTYSGNSFIKTYLISKRGELCEQCKRVEWEGIKIPLTTHHIDGDAANNLPSNLQLLCWNCHAITKNYGKKNLISARKTRYKSGAMSGV